MAEAQMPKEAADLQERVKAFNSELIPLLGKYKLGLGAHPALTPDGRIVAVPHMFDDTPKEKKEAPADGAPQVTAESLAAEQKESDLVKE